jgi:NAD(P)-dependent dehydrogenase (short-subunit alcohol dehydrogenase family)
MQPNNYSGALQQPLKSGFNQFTTAAEVIKDSDLTGKVVIVTGGNTGIGLETTRVLASAGATVIVAARDLEKAKRNLDGITNVDVQFMDLMLPDTIDAFADNFLATYKTLHMLINNAGIMWVPLRRDARGIESQLATNYIAQFHLTARLWPSLKRTNGARVVNVSSQGHQFAPFHFDDPNFLVREYDTLIAYGQSKTASNLFALEFDARAAANDVRAFSVHPGSIGGTELAREAPLSLFQKMGFFDADGNMLPEITASLKTIPQGAATSVWCATSPALNNIGGVYCEDVDIAIPAEQQPGQLPGGVCRYSLDKDNAKHLWQWTEQTLGTRFIVD